MILTEVDSRADLFWIKDVYPDNLIEEFLSTDHLAQPWRKEDWQHQYPRRKIIFNAESVYGRMNAYIQNLLNELSDDLSIPLLHADTGFWLDEPGFTMTPHLDNLGVMASMQIFLNYNDLTLGTVFYNPDGTVRKAFPYELNSGYIMFNNPGQVHGMGYPVPDNTYRICSYTWLTPKT